MKIKAPKGTVLVRKYFSGQNVSASVASRKHGTLRLIAGRPDKNNSVIAFYGKSR